MRKPQQYRAETKLEGQVALILMKAGVTGVEIDECLAWAFGENALYLAPYPGWIDRWKTLHPEYPVRKEYSFVKWIYVVGFLFTKWKESKGKEESRFRSMN